MILPNAINNGLATATTPSTTAITFLTGLGKSPKALATVLRPSAKVEITGAKASPNSIAEFFTSLKATCNLCPVVSFILSIASVEAPVESAISFSVLLKSCVPPFKIANAPVPASLLPHNWANASLSPSTD